MKYNKSKIMKRAHELVKGGETQSDALCKAWVEAKIEQKEYAYFMIQMKTSMSSADFATCDRLTNEVRALKAQLNPVKVA